ncbi:unnamed protein product [Linum trigynum]|uniref:Uncharacterized protein n=1 Tax=Linum trigynum TaxID=586398 RepID=A0AAV2F8C1_9ROSI
MEMDRGCNQLNPAWLDLKFVCWNVRIQDDRADVGDPWSVVVLHSRTQRGWWKLSPICLGDWVVPQDLIHWGNLHGHPEGLILPQVKVPPIVFVAILVFLFEVAAQMAVEVHFLRSQSCSLLSP